MQVQVVRYRTKDGTIKYRAHTVLDLVTLVENKIIEVHARPKTRETGDLGHVIRGNDHVVRRCLLREGLLLFLPFIEARRVKTKILEIGRPLVKLGAPRVQDR